MLVGMSTDGGRAAGAAGTTAGASGVDLTGALGPRGSAFLKAWFAAAVALGLVLPAGVLARWGRDAAVRRALGPYLRLLLVQITTEALLPRVLPSWTVLASGTCYTSLRTRQLRTATRDLATAGAAPGRRAAGVVVRAGRIFWSANLAVLGTWTVAVLRTGLRRSAPPR